MRRLLGGGALWVVLLSAAAVGRAEPLHPPAPPRDVFLPGPVPGTFVPAPVFYPPPPAYRPSAYQHWYYYGVTTQGKFRPRAVFNAHQEAYILYNGQFVPGGPLLNLEFMPIIRD